MRRGATTNTAGVPAKSRDPYAAAEVGLRDGCRLSLNNNALWLWVPAFRRDDNKASPPQRQRDQAERADHHAPPGEQDKAVPRDVAEKCLHHDDRGDERHHETDRDNAEMARGHVAMALVEIIGEGADHGRNREEEGEFR